MDAAELKAVQAPFKERYKSDPEAAVVTLEAEGRIGEGVTCSVQTGKALVEAGLHPATGGPGTQACSGDMLLEALAACAGVTLNAVATALEIPIREGRVLAEGDLDFRGTLGVAKDAPVGFRDIRLRFELDTDASQEQLDTLIKLTERYCVVYQTLRSAPPVEITDARGLNCPMPLVKARQAMMVVDVGASICVLATDPEAKSDFERFCETTGHRLLSFEQRDDVLVFVLEKA